jgi:hypothetical protein
MLLVYISHSHTFCISFIKNCQVQCIICGYIWRRRGESSLNVLICIHPIYDFFSSRILRKAQKKRKKCVMIRNYKTTHYICCIWADKKCERKEEKETYIRRCQKTWPRIEINADNFVFFLRHKKRQGFLTYTTYLIVRSKTCWIVRQFEMITICSGLRYINMWSCNNWSW